MYYTHTQVERFWTNFWPESRAVGLYAGVVGESF